MIASNKLKEIEAARARLAKLEADASAEIRGELATLPARYGFDNAWAFNKAVRRACGVTSAKPRKARVVITPDMIEHVAELARNGIVGNRIAQAVGISLPSVNNIKKQLGLVKARKAK